MNFRMGVLIKMTNLLIKLFIHDSKDINNLNVRKQYGMLSGFVGIICNTILFFAKLFIGITTSSIAVSADAFNNLADAGASIVTLACFKIAGNPADKEHPFGHGRIEYIAGLIVSVAIIITGLSFVKSSIEKIFSPEPIAFSTVSLIILMLSLLLKLWMCLFNRKLGGLTNSAAMKAASLDSLSDVAVTAAVIISMIITHFTGISIDAYTGIVVSIFILLTGIGMIKETLSPLLGQAPDPNLVKKINNLVLSHKEVIGIHELMVHNYGPGKSVISLHAEMSSDIDIFKLHDIIDTIEGELKTRFNCQSIIHLDPIVTNDKFVTEIREKLSELAKLIHPKSSVYDLRIVPGNIHSTLIFDLSVPFDLKQTDNEIISLLKQAIKVIDQSYNCIIKVNRDYFEPNPKIEGNMK